MEPVIVRVVPASLLSYLCSGSLGGRRQSFVSASICHNAWYRVGLWNFLLIMQQFIPKGSSTICCLPKKYVKNTLKEPKIIINLGQPPRGKRPIFVCLLFRSKPTANGSFQAGSNTNGSCYLRQPVATSFLNPLRWARITLCTQQQHALPQRQL